MNTGNPAGRCPALDFDHHTITYAGRLPAWEALRAHGPVAWSPRHGGFWAVCGHREVSTVLRDAATFSSRRGADGRGGQAIPEFLWPRPNVPGEYDGAEHARLRRGFTAQLSPATITARRGEIEALVRSVFNGFEGRTGIDATRELAVAVPALTVLTIMGLDTADAGWMGWSAQAILTAQSADPERQAALRTDLQRIERRILEQVAERRARPRDDIVTAYATMTDDAGNPLSDEDLLSVLVNSFLFGGLVTAAEVLANAVVELDRDRALRRRLLDDPDLIPGFVNEMTRYVTPAHTTARTATRDTELGGCAIRAGDRVLVMLAAADFDADAFADPTRIDPARQLRGQLAFGLGAHFCPGAPLAKLEMELTIRELLRRMPDYRVLNPELVKEGVATNAQGWHSVLIAPTGEPS